MYQGVQVCKQCGANLTLDDMRKTNCPYCGTVFPHQAMAVEHAAVVNQVLSQQGVPTALNPYQQQGPGQPGPYGAGPQIGGVPYNQYVQGHVNAANRMVKISLIVGLVITVAVIGAVLAILLIAM